MPQTGQRVDPYGSFDFRVEIGGIFRGSFQEVSGLDSSIDVAEYREGGNANPSVYKLPGRSKYSNVTCKRGITDDDSLWNWHMQWVKGDPAAQRLAVGIVLLDRTGRERMRWHCEAAWPVKWTGPTFNAKGNEVAIETFEI